MLNIQKLFIFFISCWTSLASAYSHLARDVVREREYRWALGCGQAFTLGTYDEEGEGRDFQGEEDYFSFECEGDLRYGLSHRLEVRGGWRLRHNIDYDSEGVKRKAGGLESVMAALRYRTGTTRSHISFLNVEVRGLLSDSVTQTQYDEEKEVALGDEGPYFRISKTLIAKLSKELTFSGDFGVVLPGDGQSVESDLDLGLSWNKKNYVLGGGLYGVNSFNQDDFTDNPWDKPHRYGGRTKTIGSINRRYYGVYGSVRLILTDFFSFEFQGGRVLNGRSWDEQIFSTFHLIYHDRKKRRHVENRRVIERFKQYDIEAEISKVASGGRFVKIDKGATSGIEKGMRFDFYKTDFIGKNVLLSSGIVFKVGVDTAIVKVLRVFKEDTPLKEGQLARGKKSSSMD
ncbi:MAG: hypothetical protein OXB88_10310 [Bacteriovoracales bacterium]|nr:hypothetical protein [Bacteriovoracales bacterium]